MKNLTNRQIKRNAKRVIAILLAMVLSCSGFISNTLRADEKNKSGVPLSEKYSIYEVENYMGDYADESRIPNYRIYSNDSSKQTFIEETIEIALDSIIYNENNSVLIEEYENRDSFYWDKNMNSIEFEVNLSQGGVFQIEIDYYLESGNSNAGKRSLYIDNKLPFVEANNVVFYRYFKDKGEPVINSLGDETRPSQIEIPGWESTRLIDTSGIVTEPFKFYLDAGVHTIKMDYNRGDMAISGIRLVQPSLVKSYIEVENEYEANGYQSANVESVDFQAELTAIRKNDPTLRREEDGDPIVQPISETNRRLNVLGGYRWRAGNQMITWQFEVHEDGLYKIAIREKQSWNDGLPSYRQIAIDGEVPFQEMLEYTFDYSRKWNTEELSDDQGTPYEFYLTKGVHTISMTVKFGEIAEVIESISEDIKLLSDILLDITLIAGGNPDPNYDYGFFNKISTLESDMLWLIDSMQWKYDRIKSLADKIPAMANNFLTIKSEITSMVDNPYTIAKKIGDLTSAQESLSNWYLSLQSSPLVIDYFKLGNVNENMDNKVSNVVQRLRTTAKLFLSSFVKDYDNVGSILNDDINVHTTLDVWIARGTEWAEVIKELADEEFTPSTGIAINVNVLPATQLSAGAVNALMLSITSGKAPDVALGVDATSPVEFAIRDAVYDLSTMKDFEQVKGRFVEATLTPYEYNDGIYAIPETMDFNVMFYRKDILSQYGIQMPETRQELYGYTMPALYQNGLEFYFARDFTQFLFQNGGEFYTDDGLKSALDTAEAFRAFKEYTEMFTNYGVPEVANFYQYMRSGVMPLGVGNFGLYMQLSVAAPELAGKWGIAPLPGVMAEDGTIDRTAGAITGQGDVILKQSEYPEESWEFLKWWSSANVQTQFAREVEALMGAEARWNTANKEAFLSLDWSDKDIEVIKEQWLWAKETPVVLGGYFTTRHLTNAWTTVVVSGGDVRNALEQAVKEINRELRMKQEEYGVRLDVDEK